MKNQPILIMSVVLTMLVIVFATKTAAAQDPLKPVRGLTTPVGVDAPRIFAEIKNKPFEERVKFSKKWIQDQITFYDTTDAAYRESLKEMIDGGGDDGVEGMRGWLQRDPASNPVWDNNLRRNVGEDGYSRAIALNAAFPPGSNVFRLIYGGIRRYDSKANTMTLDGTKFPGVNPKETLFVFQPANAPLTEKDSLLSKFAGAVRQQMFRFYEAFSAGKINRKQVDVFNEAYASAGGCAMTTTERKTVIRTARYLNAVNLMAKSLGELGFKVQPVQLQK